jgi:hypothetical protein
LPIEDITSEPIEDDEMNNELVQTEETAFEESKMEHHLSPPLLLSEATVVSLP